MRTPSNHDALVKQVVRQMMKGPFPGRLKATPRQISAFTRRHEEKIRWILEKLPHHKRASSSVPAVLTKSLVVYGVDKTLNFCEALTKMKFRGSDDPAHLLWLYLNRINAREETVVKVYAKTIAAVRAYMEDKKVTTLRPSKQDIFEWDEEFTLPDDLVSMNDAAEVAIREIDAKTKTEAAPEVTTALVALPIQGMDFLKRVGPEPPQA